MTEPRTANGGNDQGGRQIVDRLLAAYMATGARLRIGRGVVMVERCHQKREKQNRKHHESPDRDVFAGRI